MLFSIVLITGTAPNTAASKPKNKFDLSKPSKNKLDFSANWALLAVIRDILFFKQNLYRSFIYFPVPPIVSMIKSGLNWIKLL